MIAVRVLLGGVAVREALVRDGTFLIGRAPENDLVIADPSVSRRHARVRFGDDGAAWLEDAGSRHGLRVDGQRMDRVAVPRNLPVRCALGLIEVELSAVSLDATVELPAVAAAAVRPAGARRRALAGFLYWIASVAGALALLATSPEFWSPWEQGRASRTAWTALVAAVAVPVLVFLLIGLLRIVGRRARMTDALRAFAIVSWTWVLVTFVLHAASYGMSVAVHGLLTAFAGGLVLAASVAYLAGVGRAGPKRRFFLAWLAAAGLFLAAAQAAGHLAARQAGMPALDYEVSAPVGGVSGPATGLDSYLAGVQASFDTAARRAAEERGRADAGN